MYINLDLKKNNIEKRRHKIRVALVKEMTSYIIYYYDYKGYAWYFIFYKFVHVNFFYYMLV